MGQLEKYTQSPWGLATVPVDDEWPQDYEYYETQVAPERCTKCCRCRTVLEESQLDKPDLFLWSYDLSQCSAGYDEFWYQEYCPGFRTRKPRKR